MLVQDFVDAINDHRNRTASSSDLICVDESISRWYGNGGHWIEIGLPQYIDIYRKPGNGREIQNSACGKSGIMLHLELVRTAEDEKKIDFEGEKYHGTEVLRRLVAAYSGTRRILCADSYFASVESAEMLLCLGLKFIWVIKTATKKYPMKYLSRMDLSERDQCVSIVRKSFTGEPSMMAAVWVDSNRPYFISTTTTTMQGKPYSRVRWRQLEDGALRVELSVPQPILPALKSTSVTDDVKRVWTWRRKSAPKIGLFVLTHLFRPFACLTAGFYSLVLIQKVSST